MPGFDTPLLIRMDSSINQSRFQMENLTVPEERIKGK